MDTNIASPNTPSTSNGYIRYFGDNIYDHRKYNYNDTYRDINYDIASMCTCIGKYRDDMMIDTRRCPVCQGRL